jgi:uncharacterized coiled-coil protein SlyX
MSEATSNPLSVENRAKRNGSPRLSEPDEPRTPEEAAADLPERILQWIDRKHAAYKPRSPQAKNKAEKRAEMVYAALERLEILYEECPGIDEKRAEFIVFRCLGKPMHLFQHMVVVEIRYEVAEKEKREAIRLAVSEARVEAQQPLIEALKDAVDALKDSVDSNRKFMDKVWERLGPPSGPLGQIE